MSRPVIGVSSYRQPASWAAWEQVDAALLPARYVDSVRAGGGTPVLLPPLGPADNAADVLRRLDGLIIAGGSDVNPSRYGELPHVATAGWRDDRDVSELALLDAAQDLSLPVLGICRGMQVMAVRAGGTLHQHVPDLVHTDDHNLGPNRYGEVKATPVPGTRLAAIFGDTPLRVPCHHHQSVATHPGYRAVAWADDGILEAMEAEGDRFELGVQWHPETDPSDMRLFQALTRACG